jgi:hypothetical protein
MSKRIFTVMALTAIVAAGCISRDGIGPQPSRRTGQEILAALKTQEQLFVSDGANDFHVKLAPRALSDPVVTELLDALSSSDASCTVYFRSERPTTVPVGYLVLDYLLCCSSHSSSVFLADFSPDDAPWCNVKSEFFFYPDVLERPGGAERMGHVATAWKLAHREGKLLFGIE